MSKFYYSDGDTVSGKEYDKVLQHCYNSSVYAIESWGYNEKKIRDRLSFKKRIPSVLSVDGENRYPVDETVERLISSGILDDDAQLYHKVYSMLVAEKHSLYDLTFRLSTNGGYERDKVEHMIARVCAEHEIDLDERELSIARKLVVGDKRKSYARLARKGFSPEVIENVLNES